MTPEGPEIETKDVNPGTADGSTITDKSTEAINGDESTNASHASLKYSLLGPSLTKAGQDSVDQSKVCVRFPAQFCCMRDVMVSVINTNSPNPGLRDHLQRLKGIEIL